jgi:PKD repeat protein
MKKILQTIVIAFIPFLLNAQTVFWFEDFDNNASSRWNVSGNHPTPAGIPGLVYGTNNNFDYFVINEANTPELSGPIAVGLNISAQGQFVRGRHYDCAAPNNLPNPFVNSGAINRSLHITSQAGCSGLIYAGTPGFDDWNCITISGNDFPLTQTEQFAALNQNIDATGKCNIKLTADFFLGGSANGLEAHSTILYSIDGGVSWKIVQDNLSSCSHFIAGSCNNWNRRTFQLPADADNQPDLRIAFRWVEDGNTNNNTQDYALGASFNVDNVMLSSCAAPDATFISQAGTNVCKGQTAQFTSSTAINPGAYLNCFSPLTDDCTIGTYNWNISPASFIYVGGTNANSANPQVQFTANGIYSVTMTVSTCGGTTNVIRNNLITVANCPPVANFSVNNNLACSDPASSKDTLTFTDMSSTFAAAITAWNWTFSPATVSFVGGTTAASQHPSVVFNAPGTYQVSLQVTTAEGTDTEIKTSFITAISCDCGGGVGGPVTLYSNNFTAGAGTFTLNSVEGAPLSTTSGNENNWIVNNVYSGGFFGPTPNRGGGNYLHIRSNLAVAFGSSQAVFNANNSGLRSFAKTPIINASGATGVSLNFWMLNASSGANGLASVYYSTNGGTSWTLLTTYNNTTAWTYRTITNAAFDNQANLRFGFMFNTGTGPAGALDPAFSIDEVLVTAAGAAALPNTWTGTVSSNWATAGNWSTGAVPTSTTDVLVPATLAVGAQMPIISAAANAKNVCNYGTITLSANNTLTITDNLLNEGVITSNTTSSAADVIFTTNSSTYRGSGTMYDVDVSVSSSNLTLESNLTARSLNISTTGTVNLSTFTLAINKNLTKTAGTLTAVNGEIHFNTACASCVDNTSNADITLNAAQSFGNIRVTKPAGIKASLMSAVTHTINTPKTLTIQSGILDVNTNTLSGTGNLTMNGGELQIAKCATVVPELTGTYTLPAGKVNLDGTCNQITRVGVPGSTATVFSENFESPNIAANALIAGNIPGWTEAGSSAAANFRNNEASGLSGQTANITLAYDFMTPDQVETLSYGPINFGTNTINPRLRFDYQSEDLSGVASVLIEVLYKSTLAGPWIVGASYYHGNPSVTNLNNIVNLAGASSTFYIGFRVTVYDICCGADGKVTLDNIVVTGESNASKISYWDVEYSGTGIKTFDNGSLHAYSRLYLSLPTTLGNYVNTGNDTCFVYNSDPGAVVRSGGHIVGYLGRDINPSGSYTYHVGSDNASGDTYYEPIVLTTNAINGASNIVAKFFDNSPNPTTVNNVTFLTPSGNIDTIKTVETEGYWHLVPNTPVIGGNYRTAVSPSSYWTLSKPWAQEYYALLKQDNVGSPWDFVNGGIRVNDSTTTAFSDFSNFALAFADTNLVDPIILPINLTYFIGDKVQNGNLLKWLLETEIEYFDLERSADAINFQSIAKIEKIENLSTYEHLDNSPINGWNYYRLKMIDHDGSFEYSNIVAIDNKKTESRLVIMPNPASTEFQFDFIGLDENSDLEIEIVDVNGRSVLNRQFTANGSRLTGTVDTDALLPGFYFVKFKNGTVQKTLKLVIKE